MTGMALEKELVAMVMKNTAGRSYSAITCTSKVRLFPPTRPPTQAPLPLPSASPLGTPSLYQSPK